MEIGRTYIGRLPGYSGPVFVRRRRKSFANPFGIPSITSIFAPAPMNYQYQNAVVCQPQPSSSVYLSQPPPAYTTRIIEAQQPPPFYGTTSTTTTTHHEPFSTQSPSKYTCASCGRFRSARYHYRHPLAQGETPRSTLCRRCVRQHTSSEEYEDRERARRKKWKQYERYRRRHRRSESSEEWSSSSSQEERRRRRPRYRSSRSIRRSVRSGSGNSTRVYIVRRPAERQEQTSSDDIRIVRRYRSSEESPETLNRRTRSNEELPSILRRPRHRYGPYDGHYSYEDYHSDEEFEDDGWNGRARSRSRSHSRHSIDDSDSVDEDYIRVSTSTYRRRPFGLLDCLSRPRSLSRSRSHSRWGRRGPASFEEESVRISIRSREPSPLRYERHEREYEERLSRSDGFPWGDRSDSMLAQRDIVETRSDNHFDRPSLRHSGYLHDSRRRSLLAPPRRSVRVIRGYSPGLERRVRFARSRSSSSHGERRRYRRSSDDELVQDSDYRYLRGRSPSPMRYESRHHHSVRRDSHHDDFLAPPSESYRYVRRRSRSREHSGSSHGSGNYEARRRLRVRDV